VIHVVTPENRHQYTDAMEQACRLRHRVFVDEMGWVDLYKEDGCEVDQFDDDYAVHMLYLRDGEVLGYQRMLPTTRPHLLSEVMPQLCEGDFPAGTHIWEWTRYCVQPAHRERGRVLSPVANALVSGIVEWGLASGVSTVLMEMNPLWLLRLVQMHFRVTPLGLPKQIGGQDTVAVQSVFDRRTLAKLRAVRGNNDIVLANPPSIPTRLAS
jgi:acyl-homoserine lactone synthase